MTALWVHELNESWWDKHELGIILLPGSCSSYFNWGRGGSFCSQASQTAQIQHVSRGPSAHSLKQITEVTFGKGLEKYYCIYLLSCYMVLLQRNLSLSLRMGKNIAKLKKKSIIGQKIMTFIGAVYLRLWITRSWTFLITYDAMPMLANPYPQEHHILLTSSEISIGQEVLSPDCLPTLQPYMPHH